MNTDFVINMSSKADYFDSDRVLSKWGFTDSQCHCCGINNSDINGTYGKARVYRVSADKNDDTGLLMQCGKCKKAYYCSMKCFNEHLPEHQKYCGTKEMFSQPTGSGVEMACKKKPILDGDKVKKAPSEPTPKRKAPKKKKSKKAKGGKSKTAKPAVEEESIELTVEDIANDNIEADEPSELGDSKVQAADEEEEEFDIGELADQMSALGKMDYVPASHDSISKMNHSFSEFGRNVRGKARPLPADNGFVKESVDLRQTEMFKREYSWMTPEWINKQLKKTPKGRDLLEKKNGPVTDIRFLLEEGLITWEKPSWTKPKLKPTQRGKQIKEEALELENSFREEFGHASFYA